MTRVRTKNELVNGLNCDFYTLKARPTCSGTRSWAYESTATTCKTGKFSQMTDVVTPGFGKLQKQGHFVFNPMSKFTIDTSVPTGSGAQYTSKILSCTGQPGQGYDSSRRDGPVIGSYALSYLNSNYGCLDTGHLTVPDHDRILSEVSTEVQAKRGMHSDAQLWESLAQVDQALGLISSYIDEANKVVKKTPLVSKVKGVAGLYLATRYGLRPLMNDIETVFEGLTEEVGMRLATTRANATSGTSLITQWSTTSGPLALTYKKEVVTSLSLRAMSLDQFAASVGSNIGFTTKGLLTTPWELLPWSFVIDWFANVGSYIAALTPAVGFNQKGSCYVTTLDSTATLEVISTTAANPSSFTIDRPVTGVAKVRRIDVTRTIGLPAPALVVKSDFRFDNATRCLDSLALLIQQLWTKRSTFDHTRQVNRSKTAAYWPSSASTN